MSKVKFKGRLIDILDELDDLLIKDIAVDNKNDAIEIYLIVNTKIGIFADNPHKKR